MSLVFRLLGPAIAATTLAAPIGDLTIVLVLLAMLTIGAGAMALADAIRRDETPAYEGPGEAEADTVQLFLKRRTLPHLRARHPTGVVRAQVIWRHAAEAHRRARERA